MPVGTTIRTLWPCSSMPVQTGRQHPDYRLNIIGKGYTMKTFRTNRCILGPTLFVAGLLMPVACSAQDLLGPGVRGVTIDEARLRSHVMRPPYLNGVESDKGLDDGGDIVHIPTRPIGLPRPHLDVQGFGKAMEAALKDSTAGYILSLRQNGNPVFTHAC